MDIKNNRNIRIGDVLKEFGYVTEGIVTVVIGGEEHIAHKGESFYFTAGKPHHLENRGKREAKVIWISSPPSF